MSANTKKNGLARLLLLVGFIVILVVFFAWQKTRTSQAIVDGLRAVANSENTSGNENIVANVWNWDAFSAEQIIGGAKSTIKNPFAVSDSGINGSKAGQLNNEFDIVLIYAAFSLVELGENGDVVFDKKVLRALQDFFTVSNETLSLTDLEQLKALIEMGLPGNTGEQIAKVSADFYRYNQEKTRFESKQKIPKNIQEVAMQYEQIKAIREHHFGDEVALKLFGEDDQLARYTLNGIENQVNPD